MAASGCSVDDGVVNMLVPVEWPSALEDMAPFIKLRLSGRPDSSLVVGVVRARGKVAELSEADGAFSGGLETDCVLGTLRFCDVAAGASGIWVVFSAGSVGAVDDSTFGVCGLSQIIS